MPGIVRRVWWRAFAVPFRSPFASSRETLALREGLLVFLETDDGRVGMGEASPLPGYGGGSVAETAMALDAMAARAVGTSVSDCWRATRTTRASVSRGALAAARCGIETAIADVGARAEGMALGTWLARAEGLPHNAGPIPVNAVLGDGPPGEMAAAAGALVREGYRALKLKVGGDPALDAARVTAVREAAGSAAEIRVDANQGWSLADARAFFRGVETCDVALCEEPLREGPGHFEALAGLRRQSGALRIAVDESCRTEGDLRQVVEAGAADAVVIKPMTSGLSESVAMLRAARAAALEVIVTSTFDTGAGVMCGAHLASLLPEPRPACGLATLNLLEDDLVLGAPAIIGGLLHLPAAAGLGVEQDGTALQRYGGHVAGSAGR